MKPFDILRQRQIARIAAIEAERLAQTTTTEIHVTRRLVDAGDDGETIAGEIVYSRRFSLVQ